MTDLQETVREFHDLFGFHAADIPAIPPDWIRAGRARLLVEECAELVAEVLAGMDGRHDLFDELCEIFADRGTPRDRRPLLAEVTKEQADLAYVLGGAAVEWGLPLDAAVAEVHRSNMAKLGPDGKPVIDANGKARKPPGWEPPDLWGVLHEAMANGRPAQGVEA